MGDGSALGGVAGQMHGVREDEEVWRLDWS